MFQFDYDLTFAAFFMNPDGTVYGRYGSRSDHDAAEKDISMEGLEAALAGALELHRNYPANRDLLQGKQPLPVKQFNKPEQYPSLAKYKSSIDYTGKVAASCIHCHQVREADRIIARKNQEWDSRQIYPYPMPEVVGLTLDPRTKATVKTIAKNSPAAASGLHPGDEILNVQGQPILSIADVQWILHHSADAEELSVKIARKGSTQSLKLSLPQGWREKTDISWRVSTWDLRKMVFGGLVLKDLPDSNRKEHKLKESDFALEVNYVGQYGQHAAGKNAGFKKGDILLEAKNLGKRASESQAIAHLLRNTRPGDKLMIPVLRGKERIELTLPMQ